MWLLALLILIDLLILSQTGKRRLDVTVSASVSNGEQWTVYGTMGCGWTRKQLDYMKKNGKPFKFVDCDKEGCSGMEAFPTLVSPNGEKIVGYNEI
jgi:glutaredoxin